VSVAQSVLVQLTGVTVTNAWSGRASLDQIDLAIAAGRITAILGPNGAGKSTLLDVIAGLTTISDGRAALWGQPIEHWSLSALAARRAWLPQQDSLQFPLTVRELIELATASFAGPKAADPWIDKLALHPLLDRPYTTLSGGERRRAQIARALSQCPPATDGTSALLLLDEPLAGLDLHHQALTLRCLRDFAELGGTVLLSLHDPALALDHADDAILLKLGRCVASGAAAAVLQRDQLQTVFEVDFDDQLRPQLR